MKRFEIFILFSLLLWACGHTSKDKTLNYLAGARRLSPEQILDSLAAIDVSKLSTENRHFYDFLTIKFKDRANIKHTSDSLILDVIKYYENSSDKSLRSEAYYYAGRVYSDLDNYPTALEYFHAATDEMSDDDIYNHFGANVYAETGKIFGEMKLYDKAENSLKRAIKIDSYLEDILNLHYHLRDLGELYLEANKNHEAEICFLKINKLYDNLTPLNIGINEVYLSSTLLKRGELDSAVFLIGKGLPKVNSSFRNKILPHVLEVYLAAGKKDSVLKYVSEIIRNKDFSKEAVGYSVLLSPDFISKFTNDSLLRIIESFKSAIKNSSKGNDAKLVLTQQSFYNYRIKEKERIKDENKSARLKYWIAGGVLLVLLIVIIILFYKNNQHKNNESGLLTMIAKLQIIHEISRTYELEEMLNVTNSAAKNNDNDIFAFETCQTDNELRQNIIEKLLELYKNNKNAPVSEKFIFSDVNSKICEHLKNKKIIVPDNPLWEEIEKLILEISPDFINHLKLLTRGKITTVELQTAFLIKFGFTPTEMAILFGKTKGSISSRRETLGMKIFDKKMKIKEIDGIIRLM